MVLSLGRARKAGFKESNTFLDLGAARKKAEFRFEFNTNGQQDDHKIHPGPWILRKLKSRVEVDIWSALSYYRHQLTCLDQLMTKVNCKITAFYDKVQDIVYQLESLGKSVRHMMESLPKGYESVSDKELVKYFRLKKYKQRGRIY